MNWDTVKGSWKQTKGRAKQKWASLTDDDLKRIDGNREELVGRLQKRYGMARDQAEREADDFCRDCEKSETA